MIERLPSAYDYKIQREGLVESAIRDAENGDTSSLVLLLNEHGAIPDVVKLWIADVLNPIASLAVAAKVSRRSAGNPGSASDIKSPSGCLGQLIEALRSAESIPLATKQWLADLFDPDAGLAIVARIQRRRAGKPPKFGWRVLAAAIHVVSNINGHSKREALIEEAIAKYSNPGKKRISRSAVNNCLRKRYPALSRTFREAKRKSRVANSPN